MADILLNKSAVSQSISCVPDARFVFGFSPEDATLSRSGDDFVLTFEDGSTITLAGFYTTYSSEQMPSFSVEGAEISGEDFFTAMNEPDLMPAAGPAQQAADGARYRSWANMELLDGIDRLGGLDVGWQDPTPDDDDEGGADDINWPVSIVPGTPAGTPDVPAYDENGSTVAPGLVVEHLIVHESALKGGNPGEGDESVTDSGSMLISARDGVQSIAINGVTVVSGEALTDTLEIATDEGVLTVTGFTFDAASGEGVLEFKFDLSNNTLEHEGVQGENGIGHVFTVTVTDIDSESASADIFVEVVDDMPEAEGEEGETLREAVVVAESEDDIDLGVPENSGNVLRNEHYGADGKAAEYVTWGDASVSGDAPLASYGSLALAEDGSWKFVLNADSDVVKKMSDGDSVTVSVPYTVTDADGDTAQATLTFKIEGADNAVSIVPDPEQPGDDPTPPVQPGDDPTPPVQPGDDPTYPDQPMVDEDPEVHGDELTVYEAGLEDGTAPGQQDVSVSGSMSIYAPDVLTSVVVSFGGSEVELFGGQTASFDIGVGDNGAAGVFEASYNANTGKLEYTFTLNDDHQHDAARDSADWTVGVTVKDSDGSADATSIKLTIVDDKPVAVDDYAGIVKANTSLAENATVVTSGEKTSLAGSVLTGEATAEGHEAAALKADTLGADGVNGVTWAATATVGNQTVKIEDGTAVTDYGTLTLNADGTYSFTIADSAAVQAMAPGATVTVSVGYTITDADGDSSNAALTLKVEGSDDGITIVPTPDTDGEGPVLSGDQVIVYEAGLSNANATGSQVAPVATTDTGSFTIASPDGLASIKVAGVEVWNSTTGINAEASVIDHMVGGVKVGELAVTGFNGTSLSYTYTLIDNTLVHDGDNARDHELFANAFEVKVTDADGDIARGSINVTIVDDMPKAENDYAGIVKANTSLAANASDVTSDEATSLAGSVLTGEATAVGHEAAALKADTLGADGVNGVTWAATATVGNQTVDIVDGRAETDYGTLTLNADGTYSFTIADSAAVQAMAPGATVTVSVGYTITDADGDSSNAALTLKVEGSDDGITIVPTPDTDGEGPVLSGDQVIVYEAGLSNANATGSQVAPVATTDTGSFTIASPDGLASIKVAGVEVWNSTTGINAEASVIDHMVGGVKVGQLEVTGFNGTSLSYTYTLIDNTLVHDGVNARDAELFANAFEVKVTDADGDSASGAINVTIVDDMPKAENDYAGIVKANTSLAANASEVTSDEATSLAGSVLTGEATAVGHEAAALKADTLGADGVNGVTWADTATVGEQTVTIVNGKAETAYGTLTLNADGTYSFTIADSAAVQAMAPGATVTVSVGYTITDADGDSSNAALTLKVEGSDDGITVVPGKPESMPDPDQSDEGSSIVAEHLTVHESALVNGNPAPVKGETTASGSMKIAAPDGLASIKIGATEVWKNGSLTETTTVSTDEGVLTVTGYDAAKGELRFSFTLNQATQEHSAQGEDSISHKFAVTVSDKDGDSASSSIVVTVVDDMPEMTVVDPATVMQLPDGDGPIFISTGSVTANAGSDGTAYGVQFDTSAMSSLNVTLADGTTGKATVATAADGKSFTISLNNNVLFEAEIGTDGYTAEQYEIFSVAGSNDPYKLDIRFKLSDKDGDTAVYSIFVPLKLDAGASGNVHNDGLTGTNHGETITLPSGEIVAGSMGAGDSGGVSVTSGTSYPTYNVSIMLDLSASMHRTLADGNYYDGAYTRMSMAVESLLSFFDNVLARYEGQVNFHLVGFGQKSGFYNSFKTNAGYTQFTASFNSTSTAAAARSSLADLLGDWLNIVNKSNYTMATNYMLGLNASEAWFNSSSAASDGYNLAYLLTDGEPTKYILSNGNEAGDGNVTDSNTKTATQNAANSYKSSVSGVDLNCIGMGQGISNKASAKAMLDYIDSSSQCAVINSASELTAALSEGSTTMQAQLAQAGSDVITANDASVIYGDMFNTDDLVATMTQEGISHAFKSGSGYAVFQWLENPANAGVLAKTSFAGWNEDRTAEFIYEHAEKIGWETAGRIVTDSAGNESVEYYLIDVYGNVRDTSGSIVTNVSVNDLTITRSASSASNPTGSDTITGSSLGDLIFGQEGNDLIDGGAGDDIVFGGTGNDTIKGGAGNDFIVGGYGSDTLYGGNDASGIGSGSDIFVYDAQDIFHGSDGIDFLLSTGTENLSALSGTDKVNDIEVLIKGEGSLSLTSMDALADAGITVETKDGQEVLKLDSKWSGDNGVYTNTDDKLTIETSLHESGDADFATDAIILQLTTTSN